MIRLLLILLTALSANGAIYYVATTGDNSNDGSIGSPWLTIEYATDNTSASDVIIVQDGTYTETFTINDGVADRVIQANNTLDAKIVGTITQRDLGTTIQGFEIEGYIYSGGSGTPATGSIYRDNHIHGAKYGIRLHGTVGSVSEDISIIDNVISNTQVGLMLYGTASSSHTVTGNHIVDLKGYVTSDPNDIDYVKLYSGEGLFAYNFLGNSNTNDLYNGVLTDPHIDGIQMVEASNQAALTNWVFHNNIIRDVHTAFQFTATEGNGNGGLTIVSNVLGPAIANHFAGYANGNSPFSMTAHSGTAVVRHNTSYKFRSRAGFTDFDGLTLENNLFLEVQDGSENGYTTSGTTPTGSIDYNLVYSGTAANGLNNVESDPLLVDPDDPLGADGLVFTSDDGMKITSLSPAIDAASDGGDIGAYAYGGSMTISTLDTTGGTFTIGP